MDKASLLKGHIKNIGLQAKIEFPTFLMSSFGVLIYAMGVMWLTVPYHFPDAGLVGLALLLKYTIGFSPSLFILIANAGLVVWGHKELPDAFSYGHHITYFL